MNEIQFGRVVSLVRERAVDRDFRLGLDAVESGMGRLVAQPNTDFQGEGIAFAAGDVLFGKLRPYLAKVWCADTDGAAVGDFHVYRPKPDVLVSPYLKYVLLGHNFLDPVVSSVFGAKMPRADWDFIRNVSIHVPAVEDQFRIATFLDRETAKIDSMVAEQQGLVEVLRERRSALLAQIATGGDAVGDTREARLSWVDRIPLHWRVARLKDVARLESGHTPSRSREELWTDCYIPWISLHDVGRMGVAEYIDDTVYRISDAGIAASSARILPRDTVVLSRDATIGKSAIMAEPMATSQHFAAWACGPHLLPRYLWLLLSAAMQQYFDSLTDGATLRTIGMGDIRALRIPLPPIEEQKEIVNRAAWQSRKIDALIAEAEGLVAVAKERRLALISAAVTSQINMQREVA